MVSALGYATSTRLMETMTVSTRLSILRTDLANERTFLAWIRTAASMVTLGFAIDKLSAETDREHILSAISFVVLGIVCAGFGTVRYYRLRQAMVGLVRKAELSIGRVGMKWFISVLGFVSVSIMALVCLALVYPSSGVVTGSTTGTRPRLKLVLVEEGGGGPLVREGRTEGGTEGRR